MKKTLLAALSVFGLLTACSGGSDAPKEETAAETAAAADDDNDNDAAAPTPAKAEEDHPHDGSEGDDHAH